MEGLKKRVILLGGAFLAFGLAFQSMAGGRILHDGQVPDEPWLEKISPRKVGNFTFQIQSAGPDVTYKMDGPTYETLQPYGIVARVFDNGYERYDTVVIMSSKKDSFHDPRICFTAQQWLIEDEQTIPVETKKHGTIQVTYARMIRGNQRNHATFFYRGPEGFVPTAADIKKQMFWHQFFNFRDAEGVFYRVIPLHPDATKEQLTRFIDEFLTACDESSKGIL